MYNIYLTFKNTTILLMTNSQEVLRCAIKFCNVNCEPFIPQKNDIKKLNITVLQKKPQNMQFIEDKDCGKLYYKYIKKQNIFHILLNNISQRYISSLIKIGVMVLLTI
ncbi:MAG: hypothetical protein ACK4NF_07775, partial [Planctomycetota bacterium]